MERCKLGIVHWEKRTDGQVAQIYGVCGVTTFEEIWGLVNAC